MLLLADALLQLFQVLRRLHRLFAISRSGMMPLIQVDADDRVRSHTVEDLTRIQSHASFSSVVRAQVQNRIYFLHMQTINSDPRSFSASLLLSLSSSRAPFPWLIAQREA